MATKIFAEGARRDLAAALALALLAVCVFWPVRTHEFVTFDDDQYLTENPAVRDGLTREAFVWAFTSVGYAGNWHPLTWLSHLLDVTLFGLDPGAHHLVSLAFHAANAVLLFAALRVLTGAYWRSLLVAALFAVHPLHVESVAWASERKDVLSTLFWFLALLAYLRYARRRRPAALAATAGLFSLGLLAKPMLVTVPATLLLLDVWPLGRWRPGAPLRRFARLVVEKAPLLALSLASSLVTLVAQRRGGAVNLMDEAHQGVRLANVLVSYVRYLGKAVWPSGLAASYSFPEAQYPWWAIAGAALLLAGATFAAVLFLRRAPYLAAGWLWYLGTLVPVIGLVKVGAQAMADRYTYVPLVGIFLLAAWALAARAGRGRPGATAAAALAATLAVGACAVAARAQLAHWKDTEALFTRAVRVSPGAVWFRVTAEYNIGLHLLRQGRLEEAKARFESALRTRPVHVPARNNLGAILLREGRPEEAARHFREGLRSAPSDTGLRGNLGVALNLMGRHEEALEQFRAALAADPGDAAAHYNIGETMERLGRLAEAAAAYAEAVRLDPKDPQAWDSLARLLLLQGRAAEGLRAVERAVRLRPRDPELHYHLGKARERGGDREGAAEAYTRAAELPPGSPEAAQALARLRAAGAVSR